MRVWVYSLLIRGAGEHVCLCTYAARCLFFGVPFSCLFSFFLLFFFKNPFLVLGFERIAKMGRFLLGADLVSSCSRIKPNFLPQFELIRTYHLNSYKLLSTSDSIMRSEEEAVVKDNKARRAWRST